MNAPLSAEDIIKARVSEMKARARQAWIGRDIDGVSLILKAARKLKPAERSHVHRDLIARLDQIEAVMNRKSHCHESRW